MRQRNIGNVGCLKSDRVELVGQCLIEMVDDQFGQGRPAFVVVQRRFRNARIPEQPFVSTLYQPAGRRELDAPSDIFAGGPNRLVVRKGVTAIQPIKLTGEASL